LGWEIRTLTYFGAPLAAPAFGGQLPLHRRRRRPASYTQWLSDTDAKTLASMVSDACADDGGPALPWSLLAGIRHLVWDSAETDRGWLAGPALERELDERYWSLSRNFLPCTLSSAPAGRSSPVGFRSDFYHPGPGAEPAVLRGVVRCRRHPTLGPGGVIESAGITRRLLLWRDDAMDFSERDRVLLNLLRHHVYDIYRVVRAMSALPALTRRQWQVLELAVNGLDDDEIARVLVTARSTVPKHIENIFDRLDVTTRAGAFARAAPWMGLYVESCGAMCSTRPSCIGTKSAAQRILVGAPMIGT